MKEDIATSSGDISGADSRIGGKPMRRRLKNDKEKKRDPEDCLKKKIIKESDGWSFYQQNDLNIFEITDPEAQNSYMMGYRMNKPQIWGQNEITSKMVNVMNAEGGRNFTVKVGDQHSFPLKKR